MEKRVISKLLISFVLFISVVLSFNLSPLAAGKDPVFVVVGPGGPSTPGKQFADPDFSGETAIVVAGVADDNGNLAIHFSEVTVAKLLISKKPLKVDMPGADLTFSAGNIREIVTAAGDIFTLQLGYDYARKAGNRTAVTNQISIGIKNVGGNNKAVSFSPAAKLAFDVSSGAKNLKGAKKAANGQWKNTAGKKSGSTFTISMNDLGNYTVVSD
ncbi:hypothetical protein [Planomicrobium sp. CPCC 101110]|uniref:hypothetical protein n=1 Tax=Planomicrobium sp. CPCC 101110 TaxID=2599619 RepID=UPI0011B45AB9|nr:hypothetical protein [Planomicrobium sp. CPCC 101110]TWT27700.1 hypothetical protein FQV30_04070 [Planomicrobium sp. CPCC 101110]